MNIHTRKPRRPDGKWFLTSTGRQFWPLDPRPDDIHIEDIAHGLANICRFGGHCKSFYSVAQHSLIVANELPQSLRFCGLMHDATEAYIGDMVRPLKYQIPQFREIEENLWRVIAEKFGLPEVIPSDVKTVDDAVLMTERRDILIASSIPWSVRATPLPYEIYPMGPASSKSAFLQRFCQLQPICTKY